MPGISLLLFVPLIVGMFFTWRSLQSWLQKRNPKSTNAGKYALYIVVVLGVIGASPLLFPGNLKYISGAAYIGFVVVGINHMWGWGRAIRRHETADLLYSEAATAAAARVSAADGTIQEEEKSCFHDLCKKLPELSKFNADTLYSQYLKYCDQLMQGGPVGLINTDKAIAAVKGDSSAAAAVMQVSVALARANGVVDESEKKVLCEIADTLGLDPAKYANTSM